MTSNTLNEEQLKILNEAISKFDDSEHFWGLIKKKGIISLLKGLSSDLEDSTKNLDKKIETLTDLVVDLHQIENHLTKFKESILNDLQTDLDTLAKTTKISILPTDDDIEEIAKKIKSYLP